MKKTIVISITAILLVTFLIMLVLILFPQKYKEEITLLGQKYSLSPYLIASVINIESGYNPREISPVGAEGLMQIMPTTAEECAHKLKLVLNEGDIFAVDVNMEIGCYYLSYLIKIFDGNITNALCAYNWGLGNTKEWIESGNIDELGNITNIPVQETRNYLKKYNLNKFVYKNLYNYK